ncbi:hypothetical protein PpBr36_04205 [Pyricularia pennisetigena]|uniref:hypothetical protein n=1 Tax=Pyricularia pennisetigena TaxID=1578925 RepID=UPI00114F8465|nr:hypothetical protein PpBr36_04205 [Pyricularia pennisetigena]TLS26536.1 hypothetical protein PpBr36_04205 [Pyricularia pennisetigena]
MASSAPDQQDAWRVTAQEAFDSIQNPPDDSDSESPIDRVITGSSGDEYSIASDPDDDDWETALRWNWDQVSKEMLDSIDWRKSARNVQKDPSAPKPLRPPPQKDDFKGVFSYVEYIPTWTSPRFDPDKEYFGVEGEDEITFQRWKSSFWSRLRPAQAMVDSFYNPTEMAKRYGIYPKRQDGRSRLSPLDSVSRKVLLDKPITTPNGTEKSFVDMKYYKWVYDHEYQSPENAPNVAAGQSFEDFLLERSRASEDAQQQDPSEVYEKLLLFHNQIRDDQEYQRAYFNEFTTDELLAQKVLHFRDDVGYDLQGVLHPLLRREKWITTEDRGDDIDTPKLLWSFGGNRGEWSAHDDTVWTALQPALQLLTRFLRLDAPVFTSMMDYRSQRPFDQVILWGRRAAGKRQRIAWFAEVDPNKSWACLARLHDLGFNSVEWVQTILEERLELVVGSAYRDQDGRCSSRHFAWTNLMGRIDVAPDIKTLSSNWRIRIEVAAEIIWPLLSPNFTQAEKLTCSFALAATLFHEFAHAITIALETMRVYPTLFSQKEFEPGSRLSHEEHHELMIANQEMPEDGSEPFFEYHTEAEAGFAVEAEIFGGTVYPIFHSSAGNTPDHFGILTTALNLSPFPRPRPVEVNNLPIDVLPDWTPPVLEFATPLPYDVTARLFTQRFWDMDYKRFGLEMLKLYPEGRITKGAVPRMAMHMVTALAPIFGKKRAHWMTRALRELNQKGFDTIANYLNEVCRQYVLPKVTRRNWYLESHRWPFDVARVQDCLDGVRVTGNRFLVAFAKLTEDEDQRRQTVRNFMSVAQQPTVAPAVSFEACFGHYMEQLTRSTEQTFFAFISWLKALERVMALRLQQSQFLVRSYLQLDISDRCTISEGRGKLLRGHMRKIVIVPYNKVKLCLVATVNFIQSRLDHETARKYVAELEASYGHLMSIAQMTEETMGYLKPANEHRNVDGAGATLAYLPSSTLDPAARAERLRPIAMADLEFVKSEQVKEIVSVFETIFRAQDGNEILSRDQATLDDKLDELSNLLGARGVGGVSAQAAVSDRQSRPPGGPGSGPGRGQRGAANMFKLGPKTGGSSRVTKQQKTTTTKLRKFHAETTVNRLFNRNPAGKSSRTTHTFQKSTALPNAPTITGSAQASTPFTQYASANAAMMGFPSQTPGQPSAFAAPAPPANPFDDSAMPARQQQRFPLFPHPFADQTTLNDDLTPAERNWGAQIAVAQLPNDMRSYRGRVAEMLEFDGAAAASALMTMASLGPPSQDGGPGNRRQALAVHAAVTQAVSATQPATAAAGPADLRSAAASMQPVQLLTATWAAAWTPSGAGAGAGAAAVSVTNQLAEYATRRMVQEGSQSQPQSTAPGGDGAASAAAPNPQAGEVPSWTQLSTVDRILGAVMVASGPDAMEIDDQDEETQ